MAKEKTGSGNPEERIYTIPLRRAWMKVPMQTRSNRAVNVVIEFLSKHMKTDDVRVSEKVNSLIWKRGPKKPPASVKVKVSMEGGFVMARLLDEAVIKKEETPKGKVSRRPTRCGTWPAP